MLAKNPRYLKLNVCRYLIGRYAFNLPSGARVEVRKGPHYRALTGIYYDNRLASEDEAEFFSRNVTSDDVFFDIGANIGSWSLTLSPSGCRCIAVEPSSENFPILLRQAELNPSLKIQPLRMAVGSHSGSLLISKGNNSSNFIVNDLQLERLSENRSLNKSAFESVEVCTVDQLSGFFGSPSMIKIDVEGFNLEVVEGARETLTAPELRMLCIETNRVKEGGSDRIRKMEKMLEDCGFFPHEYDVAAGTLRRLERMDEGKVDTLYLRI